MSPPGRRLRTSAQVIAGALVAELVVYLGVLLAYASAGGQPALQITCCVHDIAGSSLPRCDDARAQQLLSASTVLPFQHRR
jgi:hypothetical protein